MIILTKDEMIIVQHLVLGERLEAMKRARHLHRQGAHREAGDADREAELLNSIVGKVKTAIDQTTPNLTPVIALHNKVVSMEHHRRKRFSFFNGEQDPGEPTK